MAERTIIGYYDRLDQEAESRQLEAMERRYGA